MRLSVRIDQRSADAAGWPPVSAPTTNGGTRPGGRDLRAI